MPAVPARFVRQAEGLVGLVGLLLRRRPTGWDGDVRGCWDGNQSRAISDKTDTNEVDFSSSSPPAMPPWSRSQATIGAQGPEIYGDRQCRGCGCG
jgi:hypothetical protein